MLDRLRAKPGADAVHAVLGDMTTTRAPGEFALVYLVANTLMNVTTQDEQIAVFENAARHLVAGGCFVLQLLVPQLRRVPPSEPGWVFTMTPDHVGIETFDDTVGQIASSHHWMLVDGEPRPTLGAVSLRVAVRARPHGAACRLPAPRSLGRLAP